jgi:hypothetical protein
MENSKYEWIHKKIIEDINAPAEFILLDLKDKLNSELSRLNSYCSITMCRRKGMCIGCKNRINIDYIRTSLQEIQDFARENDIDLNECENKRRLALMYNINVF